MKNLIDYYKDVPSGTYEIGDYIVTIEKSDNSVSMELSTKDNTKEIVNEYKESLKEIEDDLFVKIVDEISKEINLKEFNDLLDQETYTSEESEKVLSLIDKSKKIILSELQDKIESLVELYNKF